MNDPRPTTWLGTTAAAAPNTPALDCDGVEWSYRSLDDLAARTAAAAARNLSLGPGGAVGVAITEAPLSAVAAMWAAWRLGATVMPLDPRLPGLRAGPADLATTYRLADIVTHIEPDPYPWAGTATPAADDIHSLILTSGTTSGTRAALLTHGNVAAAVAASRLRIGNGPEDRWLLCLPMFHVGGLSVLWRSAEAGGAVVVHPSFDAAAAAAALRRGEVTIASFVPTMLQRVLEADPGPYRGVKAVLVGGASVAPDLVERGLDAGLPIVTTYGMTEACSQIATVAPGEERSAVGTVGRPLAGMQVEIAQGGIITVDGPAVSPGYFGEPRRRGPLASNDIGSFDDAGRLVVHGRGDDVILTGGENVHPAEVERVVLSHPDVSDCVVYGLPDPDWGSVVAVTVVLAGPAALDTIQQYAGTRLAPFQVPRLWRIGSETPKLRSGKPDRSAARTTHLAEVT
jgi:O-succinylbenzoic acid--CoA ligase